MEIITRTKKPSQEDINSALWGEIEAGFGVEKDTESLRLDNLREVTAMHKEQPTHPTLGKLVAMVPARDYFRLLQKYGNDETHSREFIRYMHKKVPETKVANV